MFCHRPVQYVRTFTIIVVLLLVSLKLNLSGYNFIIIYVKYAHFILSLFLSFFLLDIYLTLKQLMTLKQLT